MTSYIQTRGYYSTSFARYNTTYANENAIEYAAKTSADFLDSFLVHGVDADIELLIYGCSIPQRHNFYGAPYAASIIGLHCPAFTIQQACATGLTSIAMAANHGGTVYCLTADRTSNGPRSYWGDDTAIEDLVSESFEFDPWSKVDTLTTAELVASDWNISREELNDLCVYRHEQYKTFSRDHIFSPDLVSDNGIKDIHSKRLEKLPPLRKNGKHSIANITYKADGHTGIIVTDRPGFVPIEIIGYSYGKSSKGYMPAASIVAADNVLKKTGLKISDMAVINQHNAFAVNDIAFAQSFGIDWRNMNHSGGSLVYGHAQAPVLTRLLIEGIEEAEGKGGGYVLVSGAAAGDQGIAMIVKVG